MSASPYRRGVPILAVGAGLVLIGTVGLGWAASADQRRVVPLRAAAASASASSSAPAGPPEDPFGLRLGLVDDAAEAPAAAGPSGPPVKVPVETDPAGATVVDVTGGRYTQLCAATPCTITVERRRVATTVVALQLAGRETVRAHVKDVVDVPGGTLMLAFGPKVEGAPSLAPWGTLDPLTDAARRRLPRLRQGPIKVTGGLPSEVIARIVRQNFGRFRLCYEDALRKNPALAGRVAVRFGIDRSGAVSSVADGGSDIPDATMIACVTRGFGNLSFPQPEGGSVEVVYPIVFDPGE